MYFLEGDKIMNSVITFTKRSPLAAYFAITFAFTWTILGLAILSARGIIALPISATVLVTVGTLGPTVAAFMAGWLESGRSGINALLAQTGRWRLSPIWYALAIFIPGLVILTAFFLWRLLDAPSLPTPPAAAWFSIPILILALLLPALFEEIGWRGYALPKLQAQSSALTASLFLGIIQAFWHLPIWFIPGMGFEGLPFLYYALLVTGLSVLAGWLYNSTGGSVLIVGLLHAAINSFPAPWGAALQTLPVSEWGLNIQIPVAITVAVFSLLVVLLTDTRTLTFRVTTDKEKIS
jgi:uncharacterized protein